MHRWDALCALLMQNNPNYGAFEIAIHLGEDSPYKIGWNVAVVNGRKKYIFIDPKEKLGYTTEIKPPVPDIQIYQSKEGFLFYKSSAEKIMNSISSYLLTLTKEYDNTFLEESIKKTEHDKSNIYRYVGLNDEGIDNEINKLYMPIHNQLVEAVNSENKNLGGAVALANNVVGAYLDFEISGQIAINVIKTFIIDFCRQIIDLNINDPSNKEIIEYNLIKNEVDYLQAKILDLLKEDRVGCDLESFYKITYLAILYGKVAINLINYMKDNHTNKANVDDWWSKKYTAIDESIVDGGCPTFIYPSILIPYSFKSNFESLQILKSKQIQYVYPQLKNMHIPSIEFEKVFDALEEFTITKQPFDINNSLNTAQNPIINPNIMLDLSIINQLYANRE